VILAITFLFPAVLCGAAAAAAPVLIHLIMRTKPRRLTFPAMRFVKKTHHATLKMLKLKHLILLAMRMGAIVLAAILIARATIPAWASREDRSVPAAVALVIDNTGSMNYRYRGQTLLALAKQQAQKLIESLPPGSRVGAVALASDRAPGLLDPSLASQQVADLPSTFSHASVAAGLAQATELLRRSNLLRKDVYLLTDLTATSWREEVHLAAQQGIHYAILKCGGEDLNVMLGDLKLSASSVPVGAEVRVETSLASANIGGDLIVEAELDGEAVSQQTVRLPSGGAAPVSVVVRPKREGVVQGRVVLRNPDPLEMDNVRYFTLQVGAPAKVLIVMAPQAANMTWFLMGNAIAPGAAGTGSGAEGIRRETVSAEGLDANALSGAAAVLLADAAALTEAQWRLLEPFVRGGGALWVVAGPTMSLASFNSPPAQRLMPAALGPLESLPPGPAQHWTGADLSHPMLRPFEGADNPPLADVLCQARFGIVSRAGDAQAILEYPDKAPAILLRRFGEGTVMLWNFSPLPDRSNLASLPQFPILAGRAAAVLTARTAAQTSYAYGQIVTIPVPRLMPGAVASLRPPAAKGEQPLVPVAERGESGAGGSPEAAGAGGAVVTVPADALGNYLVRFAQAGRTMEQGFSVNAEAAESDLRPMDPAKLTPMFPEGLLIASDASEISRQRNLVTQPLDLTPALLLALLALLTAESFFANRFYRHTQTANTT
jgi:hypothetical protein